MAAERTGRTPASRTPRPAPLPVLPSAIRRDPARTAAMTPAAIRGQEALGTAPAAERALRAQVLTPPPAAEDVDLRSLVASRGDAPGATGPVVGGPGLPIPPGPLPVPPPPPFGGPRRPGFFGRMGQFIDRHRLGIASIAIGVGWVTLDSLGVVPQLIGASLSAKVVLFGLAVFSLPIYAAGRFFQWRYERPDSWTRRVSNWVVTHLPGKRKPTPAANERVAAQLHERLRRGQMVEALAALSINRAATISRRQMRELKQLIDALATYSDEQNAAIDSLGNERQRLMALALLNVAEDSRIEPDTRAKALKAVRDYELYYQSGIMERVLGYRSEFAQVNDQVGRIRDDVEAHVKRVRTAIETDDGKLDLNLFLPFHGVVVVQGPVAGEPSIEIPGGKSLVKLEIAVHHLADMVSADAEAASSAVRQLRRPGELSAVLLHLAVTPIAPMSAGQSLKDETRVQALAILRSLKLPLNDTDIAIVRKLADTPTDTPIRNAALALLASLAAAEPPKPSFLARLEDADQAIRRAAAEELASAMADVAQNMPGATSPISLDPETIGKHSEALAEATQRDPDIESFADLFLDSIAEIQGRDGGA